MKRLCGRTLRLLLRRAFSRRSRFVERDATRAQQNLKQRNGRRLLRQADQKPKNPMELVASLKKFVEAIEVDDAYWIDYRNSSTVE